MTGSREERGWNRARMMRRLGMPETGPERGEWWFGAGHALAAGGLGICIGLFVSLLSASLESLEVAKATVAAGKFGAIVLGGAVAVRRFAGARCRLLRWRSCVLALAGGCLAGGSFLAGLSVALLAMILGAAAPFTDAWIAVSEAPLVLGSIAVLGGHCLLSGAMAVRWSRIAGEEAP